MTIVNFPALPKTYSYAELWSAEKFTAKMWYGATLPSEDKGDVHKIGARWKIDISTACHVAWEGTSPGGVQMLGLVLTPLDLQFLFIQPGVNLLVFELEEPEPSPEPPPPDTEYGTLRLTIFVPRGSVPFLVRPRDKYIKEEVQIIQVDPAWYEEKFGDLSDVG